MRIICEYTDKGNNTNSYMELKRLYNTEVQIPSGYTTDTFLDTVEMLEDRGISFEVYYNTTDDGCSIFYNETAPKEAPVAASKQLTYAEVRRLISGIAFGKYDKSVAPAKISSLYVRWDLATAGLKPSVTRMSSCPPFQPVHTD